MKSAKINTKHKQEREWERKVDRDVLFCIGLFLTAISKIMLKKSLLMKSHLFLSFVFLFLKIIRIIIFIFSLLGGFFKIKNKKIFYKRWKCLLKSLNSYKLTFSSLSNFLFIFKTPLERKSEKHLKEGYLIF